MEATGNETPLSIRVATEFHDRLPNNVTNILSPLYFRYQSTKADQRHETPSHSYSSLSTAPQHVLIIVIDALRPDHVPSLPLQFSRIVVPSTWTFPSITSLHTGQSPHEHGAVAHTHPEDEEYAMPQQTTVNRTLPREFEAAGYDTFCGCAFMIPFLAVRGWYTTHRVYRDTNAEEIISDYLQWRRERTKTFAYLHLGDMHTPIQPPAKYNRARGIDVDGLQNKNRCSIFDGCDECSEYRRQRLNLYGAAYDYVEDQLTALMTRIKDNTLIVVTGDHGEAFWEHADLDQLMTDSRPNYGGGHGGTPFDMVARVPLGVTAPHNTLTPPEKSWASLRDVGPTLLMATIGESVLPGYPWQDNIPQDRSVICEAPRFGVERKAAYQGTEKVIRSKTDDVTLTAQITRDEPGDHFCELPDDVTHALLDALPDKWDDFDKPSQRIDPVLDERLEALGYKS